jgi:hypothetical protein
MSYIGPHILKMCSKLSTTGAKVSISCRYVRYCAPGTGTASRWVLTCLNGADADARESVVYACRNVACSGVLMAKGGVGVTVKCNRLWHGNDMKGMEH